MGLHVELLVLPQAVAFVGKGGFTRNSAPKVNYD